MFGPKVKLEKALYEKIKMYAEIAGYSSVQEFVHHALEKELKQPISKNTQIVWQLSSNGEFGIEQDQASDRRGEPQ